METKFARKLLENRAVDGSTITYSEFAAALGIQQAPIIRACTNILEALMREDVNEGRPILAALVVQKGSSAIPRVGFFDVLADLGCYQGGGVGPQAKAWHQQELKNLKTYDKEVGNEK